MLTTSVDGLWVLQVLAGVEVLAPELALRPHFPRVETRQAALGHPAAAELRQAGVITPDGGVDSMVVEWMTVLSRRDVALLLYVQTPQCDSGPERILLARFARWWVALERCGAVVRLSGAGTATTEQSAGAVISAQIERLCGESAAFGIRPVTLNVTELLDAARHQGGVRAALGGTRLDANQAAALALAADPQRSAQASLVALQSGMPGGVARTHIDPGAVTIIDTARGRLLVERVHHDGQPWLVVGPGTENAVASAVLAMLRRLPSAEEWYSRRKAV